MTYRSAFTFGKYKGLTVQNILEIEPFYLKWAYYHIQSITYIPELLTLLGIYPPYEIEKPGVDPEFFEKLKKHNATLLTDTARDQMNKRRKINATRRCNFFKFATQFTKRELQAINHGR